MSNGTEDLSCVGKAREIRTYFNARRYLAMEELLDQGYVIGYSLSAEHLKHLEGSHSVINPARTLSEKYLIINFAQALDEKVLEIVRRSVLLERDSGILSLENIVDVISGLEPLAKLGSPASELTKEMAGLFQSLYPTLDHDQLLNP